MLDVKTLLIQKLNLDENLGLRLFIEHYMKSGNRYTYTKGGVDITTYDELVTAIGTSTLSFILPANNPITPSNSLQTEIFCYVNEIFYLNPTKNMHIGFGFTKDLTGSDNLHLYQMFNHRVA